MDEIVKVSAGTDRSTASIWCVHRNGVRGIQKVGAGVRS
jgi:hypothetical protein